MDNDDLPPLDDFESELKTIKQTKPNNSSEQDYTKMNVRHIEDEKKREEELTKMKEQTEKVQKGLKMEEKQLKKDQFGGMKKGFLSGGSSSGSGAKKQDNIPELKAKKQNPLEIKEVQEAMKVNNYLDKTKSEWMTDNFLNTVSSNQKVGKLFSNPQYLKAIDLFKTNPKEAMLKYGNNKEFMQAFQEFSKLMGMQFQNLAATSKK